MAVRHRQCPRCDRWRGVQNLHLARQLLHHESLDVKSDAGALVPAVQRTDTLVADQEITLDGFAAC